MHSGGFFNSDIVNMDSSDAEAIFGSRAAAGAGITFFDRAEVFRVDGVAEV